MGNRKCKAPSSRERRRICNSEYIFRSGSREREREKAATVAREIIPCRTRHTRLALHRAPQGREKEPFGSSVRVDIRSHIIEETRLHRKYRKYEEYGSTLSFHTREFRIQRYIERCVQCNAKVYRSMQFHPDETIFRNSPAIPQHLFLAREETARCSRCVPIKYLAEPRALAVRTHVRTETKRFVRCGKCTTVG